MEINKISNISSKKPSTEEQFLIEFFELKGYKYEFEKYKLTLNGDSKSYRVPDFYLKRYKIFVEYYGLYNSTKEIRKEYDSKSSLYIKNNIPTIFLYPHELGIIEYVFHKRMIKVLTLDKFNLKPQLIRYKLLRFFDKTLGGNLAVLIFSFLFILGIINVKTGLEKEFLAMVLMGAVMSFMMSFIYIVVDFWRYYIKEK